MSADDIYVSDSYDRVFNETEWNDMLQSKSQNLCVIIMYILTFRDNVMFFFKQDGGNCCNNEIDFIAKH